LIFSVTLVASAIGWGYAGSIPPVYQASASLLVNAGNSADDYGSVMASEKMAETYKELLTKRPVIEQAAYALNLDPDQVARKVESRLVSRTLIIELLVKDADPRVAAAIANSMVVAFMDTLRDAVNTRPGDIAVVELAAPPAVPVSPQVTRIVVVAGLTGFVLAAGAASGIELARDPLGGVQDVRRSLSLSTLAAVPRYRMSRSSPQSTQAKRAGSPGGRPADSPYQLTSPRPGRAARRKQPRMPVSLSAPDSAATEAFRTLRTWIQFSYRGAPLPTLLVTSPLSREHTALVAANLGVVLAQAGLKTVLLDADLRRPALQKMSLYQARDLSAEPGLSGLLEGAGSWPRYVVETVIPCLHLIPAGPSPSDPLGLLSSPRMAYLIDQLEQGFQVVLIHGPPVLAASDALVLAAQVSGTMMVIESGATSRRSATRAVELLENADANVLGTVLTQVRGRSFGSGSYSDLGKPSRLSLAQTEAEAPLVWLESGETASVYRH
jgi:capsular exopolysaccharide synthesis family protein